MSAYVRALAKLTARGCLAMAVCAFADDGKWLMASLSFALFVLTFVADEIEQSRIGNEGE